jgi:DNA-binding transcriptional LysR family regulator
MTLDFAWLEDCVALAETLSFTRAAQQRNVTQPAFSRRIKALEEWTGTELFQRTTHGVALTDAGNHFQNYARTIIREVQQMRRETLEAGTAQAGAMALAATHALSFTFFPHWVRSNDILHSLSNISLISDTMLACENSMLRGDVQFLLCHFHRNVELRLKSPEFLRITIGKDILIPLCAPTQGGEPRWPITSTTRVPLLAYNEQSGLGRIVSAIWPRLPNDGIDIVFKSHLAATLLSMARAGEGVAWLPRTLARDDLESGRLVPTGADDLPIPVEIGLFRPAASLSPSLEKFWTDLGSKSQDAR